MRTVQLKNSLPYVFIIGVAVFMFRGIFASGFMSGYDNSFHYYDAYYLVKTLIPQCHWISGWSMQGLAGFPVFVDYYQTGFLFMAFLNKALFVPLNLSYKLTVLLSYIILGTGFYKMASYRFGKTAALLFALSLMLQKDVYYDRILAGMWSNYLAIGLFFIFFHFLDKNIKAMTIKRALALGLMLGAIILSHIYVAVITFIVLLSYAIPFMIDATKKKAFAKQFFIYASIPVSAWLVSSYYLYAFVVTSDYLTNPSAQIFREGLMWGPKLFFGPLEVMDSISTFLINIPILARIIFSALGLAFFIKEKNQKIKSFLKYVILFTSIALVLYMDILPRLFSWWHDIPIAGTLQISRFHIYVQIGLYIFAAYGLAKFLAIFKRKQVIVAVCVVPILLSVFFHHRLIAREATRTLDESPQMVNVHRVWKWVNENISSGGERIAYQNTVSNVSDPILNRSDVFALSGVFTKVPQIGVSRSASPFPQEKYMRNDRGKIFGKPVNKTDVSYVKTMMEVFNAGHIVTVEPGFKKMLEGSALFSKEASSGIFNIFSLNGFKKNWIDFTKEADYETMKFDNQQVTFLIRNNSEDNTATVKIAYHPFWHAYINGRQTDIGRNKYSLMQVSLPKRGFYRMDLIFNSFNPFFVILSLFGVIFALIIILKRGNNA